MLNNKTWFRGICAALCVSLLALCGGTAQAENRQKLVYEVYAGGIHALQAEMDMDLRKRGQYSLFLDAKTRGFLANLVPWEGTFESHGWRKGKDLFQPRQHKSIAYWKKEIDIKDYRYSKNGKFVSLETTDEKGTKLEKDIDPKVTDGTTDILSATMEMLSHYMAKGECKGSSDVFDGKRRFTMVFKEIGVETLKATKYNIYAGEASECTVEVVPVAGEWHKKPRGWLSIQEQGRKQGTMPTIWVAKIAKDKPAIPVKIRIKTDYGALFMHLAEYKSADEVLVAQERVKE